MKAPVNSLPFPIIWITLESRTRLRVKIGVNSDSSISNAVRGSEMHGVQNRKKMNPEIDERQILSTLSWSAK